MKLVNLSTLVGMATIAEPRIGGLINCTCDCIKM